MTDNHNEENEEKLETSNFVSHLIAEAIKNTLPSISSLNSTNASNVNTYNESSQERPVRPSTCVPQVHSWIFEIPPTVEIYRAAGQFSESQSDVGIYMQHTENDNRTRSIPASSPCVPPSYSTVIKQGRPSIDIRRDARSMEIQHISPFTRAPPPSYAEIQGNWSNDFSTTSSEQVLLGPDPIYIWCTHCGTVVVSVTEPQRSKFTHLTAAALCLFGCWPCALLPYCMNSCKNIYHYCPDCNYLFGMYRPW